MIYPIKEVEEMQNKIVAAIGFEPTTKGGEII